MKYSADQVVNGFINYVDNEVMHQLPITSKWLMGTALAMASKKVNNVIDTLKDNSIVNMLEIIDENGYIEVDDLMDAMKESADRYGKVTLDIAMLGSLTFSSSDIDVLRGYIR